MFVSPLSFFSNTDLSDWRGCFALGGTVFQTAVTISHGNPETSSRVTLASLGIGFQPNLPSMPLNNQKPTPICLYFYLLIFFHPFNPYNPCSFHLRVFFRTRIYRIDTDASLGEVLSSRQQSLYVMVIPRLRPGLLSLLSVLASSQILWLLVIFE